MTKWLDTLFPNDVSVGHPQFDFWYRRYGFMKNIDLDRVCMLLNSDGSAVDLVRLKSQHKCILFTSCAESPRYDDVRELGLRYPDVPVVWLADLDPYDYPLPSNITYIKYRHYYIRMEMLHDCFDVSQVLRIKDKKIKYKFSSLSYFMRQARAAITAALCQYARDQSIMSWHLLDNSPSTIQKDLIQSFRDSPVFSDIDWSVLEQELTVDEYNWDRNTVKNNMMDIFNPAFESSLCNFNNETDSMGWLNSGQECYNRPGPFITEKTWKTLLTGCVLLNSGQPRTIEYLKNDYQLPLDYSIDQQHDSVQQDFDRFRSVIDMIKQLSQVPLKDLIDANIDTCARVQNMLLDPEFLEAPRAYNRTQDELIATLLS